MDNTGEVVGGVVGCGVEVVVVVVVVVVNPDEERDCDDLSCFEDRFGILTLGAAQR